jgi:GNAT superfamily N-acetyltransferase
LIRRARLEDLDLIAPLFDAYRQFYNQPPNPDLARSFLTDRLTQNQAVIFLAVDEEGNAQGFTQLYPSFSSGAARPICILNDLFVIPSARRSGVARNLLHAAKEFAMQSGAIRLTLATAQDNAPARALYESEGWKQERVFCTYTRSTDTES